MSSILYPLLTALCLTLFAIPSIIKVAGIKHLYDEPDTDRKQHKNNVPTLGGLAIFAGLLFSITFWSNQEEILELQYIISSIIILFFLGLKDDIVSLVAWKKLVGQLLAATIIVHFADIRLTTLYGLFGIDAIPTWFSYLLSIFTIIVITNSFNLIDGIDTLAGSTGVLSSTLFGIWFYQYGETQYAILSFSLVGSLIGFLWYNKTPAKIFMGDTGSLIVGLIASILAIKFIELNRVLPKDHIHKILSVPVVTVAILILPLFDTIRVFFIRIKQGKSPFSADRNHIHHILIDLGLSHMFASLCLIVGNFCIAASVYLLQGIKGEWLLAGLILSVFSIIQIMSLKRNKMVVALKS